MNNMIKNADNVINLIAQNKESHQNDSNPLEIKELRETWYTKKELLKIKNDMSSPHRGTSLDNNPKKQTKEEQLESKHLNIVREKATSDDNEPEVVGEYDKHQNLYDF